MSLFDLDAQLPGDFLPFRAWTFREARVLQVATRLHLFTVLHEEPLSAQARAKKLECDPDMTERLLVALAAMSLVVHAHGLWRNRQPATLCLVEGQPLYQGDLILLAAEEWERYHRLEQYVREGLSTEKLEELQRRNRGSESYLRAIHQLAISGHAQRLARLLDALSGRRSLLDVAGAPGTYAVALCERYVTLQVTVMDHPERRELTEQVIAAAGFAERIGYREGAWREERFGEGEFDALRIGFLLGGSEAEALTPLMKAYEALKPGGLLILQSYLLQNDLNESGRAAFVNILESLFTVEQLLSLVSEAGFERLTLLLQDPNSGAVLIAHKPTDVLEEGPSELAELINSEQELLALLSGEPEQDEGVGLHRRVWKGIFRSN